MNEAPETTADSTTNPPQPATPPPPAPSPPPKPMKTVVIGQTSSGKSVLLGGLKYAADREGFKGGVFEQAFGSQKHNARSLHGFEVRCIKPNIHCRALNAAFQRVPEIGHPGADATQEVVLNKLELMVRRSWLPERIIESRLTPNRFGFQAKIEMPDGPGEALFGIRFPEQRKLLISHLQEAEGVVVCLPPPTRNPTADAQKRRSEFFRFFTDLVEESSEMENPLPWRHMAITLTKADEIFYHDGMNALTELIANSTHSRLEEWLEKCTFDRTLIQTTLNATRGRVKIAAGWSSIYGFLDDGTPNFDPADGGGLLIAPGLYDPGMVRNRWRPFQLLDPFLFAAAGHTAPDLEAGHPGFVRIA